MFRIPLPQYRAETRLSDRGTILHIPHMRMLLLWFWIHADTIRCRMMDTKGCQSNCKRVSTPRSYHNMPSSLATLRCPCASLLYSLPTSISVVRRGPSVPLAANNVYVRDAAQSPFLSQRVPLGLLALKHQIQRVKSAVWCAYHNSLQSIMQSSITRATVAPIVAGLIMLRFILLPPS